jgi:hypothetical protein
MIRGQEKCEEIKLCRIRSEDLTEIGTLHSRHESL